MRNCRKTSDICSDIDVLSGSGDDRHVGCESVGYARLCRWRSHFPLDLFVGRLKLFINILAEVVSLCRSLFSRWGSFAAVTSVPFEVMAKFASLAVR